MLLYVVDVEEGSRQWMMLFCETLRKVTKPVLLAVNKVDNAMREKRCN
jgi:GTP-binding protein